MNNDSLLKLYEQISEMKRQEEQWELEKITIQSHISSLTKEEKQWIILKDLLLSRLQILRSAANSSPPKRQELINEISKLPALQLTEFDKLEDDNTQNDTSQMGVNSNNNINNDNNTNNDNTNNDNNNNDNENNNAEANPSQSTTPLVHFGKHRRKKKATVPKQENNGTTSFNIKWILSQHLDCVRCVVFHPTLPYIATGSDDGCIRVSNLEPPKKTKSRNPVQMLVLRGHSGAVLSLAAYHNNLISSDVNGQVCVWDFSETKSTLKDTYGRIDHHLIYRKNDHTDSVWSIATNENSSYFVTASSDKTIRIYDYETRDSESISIPDGPTVASFNSDGSIFVVGCSNGHIHLFKNKKDIGTFDLKSCVISICHSYQKNEMFIACEDKNVKVFDLISKKVTKQFIAHESYTSSMTLTQDGLFLITTGPDKTIRIWNVPSLEIVSADLHHKDKYGEAGLCMAATLSSNSHNFFASGGADGIVKIFVKNPKTV